MEKTKGSPYIAAGSIGMMVMAGFGMLLSPFIIAMSSWLGNLLGRHAVTAGGRFQSDHLTGGLLFRFLGGVGVAFGIFLLISSVLQLIFGILAWKKRNDLAHTAFPLGVGIAFAVLALPSAMTGVGLISLAFPVLVIIGASMNRQQYHEIQSFYSQPPAPPPADEGSQS